jgi:hypothetical protein
VVIGGKPFAMWARAACLKFSGLVYHIFTPVVNVVLVRRTKWLAVRTVRVSPLRRRGRRERAQRKIDCVAAGQVRGLCRDLRRSPFFHTPTQPFRVGLSCAAPMALSRGDVEVAVRTTIVGAASLRFEEAATGRAGRTCFYTKAMTYKP